MFSHDILPLSSVVPNGMSKVHILSPNMLSHSLLSLRSAPSTNKLIYSQRLSLYHAYRVDLFLGKYWFWGGFPLPSAVTTLNDFYEARAATG